MNVCLHRLLFFIELDLFVQNCHIFAFLCRINYNVGEGP